MDIKTTLPISEARKKIFDIAKEVQKPNKYYTLTERGRPKAVIMSALEFESWAETLDVMKDFPNLDKDIKEARREFKKGDYIILEDLLKKEGFILNNESKKVSAVSGRHSKKSSTRNRKNRQTL